MDWGQSMILAFVAAACIGQQQCYVINGRQYCSPAPGERPQYIFNSILLVDPKPVTKTVTKTIARRIVPIEETAFYSTEVEPNFGFYQGEKPIEKFYDD